MNEVDEILLLDQLLKAADYPDVRLEQFVDELKRLPSLSERIISRCNSTLSGGNNSIRELKHAVVFLGLRRVRALLWQEWSAATERVSRSRAA